MHVNGNWLLLLLLVFLLVVVALLPKVLSCVEWGIEWYENDDDENEKCSRAATVKLMSVGVAYYSKNEMKWKLWAAHVLLASAHEWFGNKSEIRNLEARNPESSNHKQWKEAGQMYKNARNEFL